MKFNTWKPIVIFSSPAGSTRRVAEVITETLRGLGQKPLAYDLASKVERSDLEIHLEGLDTGSCLFVGSPVYACHSVPPIVDLISHLPKTTDGYAVPFVTWGRVTSGIALHEMATMLNARGYSIIGAAKIVAVHSLMWRFSSPLGEGRPNAEDDLLIQDMVKRVDAKISDKHVQPLCLEDLNYQPIDAQEVMKKASIERVRELLPPRQLDKELCTGCGMCVDVCPAQAITCDFYPEFGSACFFCYNCVRLCPEGAIKADFSKMESWLKNRAGENEERPLSQIFL